MGPSDLTPVSLDGDVSEEKLRQLLAVHHERPELDYKEECDPSDKAALVELAKDVGAMMMGGGYIVVGADSQGGPSKRVWRADNRLFDEARLAPKLAKYFGSRPALHSATHDLNGRIYAVIFVVPNADGYAMFACDGQYESRTSKKPVVAFRKGDVFQRNGTSSEPLDPDGFKALVRRLAEQIQEEARAEYQDNLAAALRELQSSFQGLSDSWSPVAALGSDLPLDQLDKATIELLRREDSVALAHMLRSAVRQAEEGLASDAVLEACTPALNRVTSIAAEALLVDKAMWVEESLRVLRTIYELPIRDVSPQNASLWLAIAQRVIGIGGLAVRLEEWWLLAELTLVEPRGMHRIYSSWLRHALTMAARAGQLSVREGERQVTLSVLAGARDVAESIPSLHTDVAPTGERLLTSLVQFDFLACLITIHATKQDRSYYPSFAAFDRWRVSAVVEELVQRPDGDLRRAVFPDDDGHLAHALVDINDVATKQFFFNWYGFESAAVTEFIAKNAG